MKIINGSLISNPINWVIVFLMLAIGVMAMTLISKQTGVHPIT